MEKMLASLLLASFVIFLFLPVAKADIGVGIRWKIEELFLNEFEEKCVNYEIYNPFNSNVTARLSAERSIVGMITRIEPEQFSLPAYTGLANDSAAKLANKQDVTICFKASLLRWPPLYPKNYSGVVLATALPLGIPGTGSASASVVQAPLRITVGKIQTFYVFVVALVILIAAVIVLILKIKKKLPKNQKKYCTHCNKYFSHKLNYCPQCGNKLT
jgi:hypothetical protein